MLIDYQKYQGHFNDTSQNIIHEPEQNRRCTDFGFVIMFIIVLGAFFGIGALEIGEYQRLNQINIQEGLRVDDELNIVPNAGIIAAGLASSVIVSFGYVLLIKAFPRPMVYLMTILSLAVIAAMALIGLIIGNLGLLIGFGVTFLIYLLVLYCLRNKIETGIAMVKIATNFISDRMQIFFTPVLKLVLTFAIGAFYIYTLNVML